MIDEFLNQYAGLLIVVFLFTAMFSLGLDLTVKQIIDPLRDKRLLSVSLLINVILVPLIAIVLTRIIPMDDALKTGLVLYALAAGTEGGPKFVQLVKGNTAFAFGLAVLLLTLTVVFLPTVLSIARPDIHIPRGEVVLKLALVVGLPIGLGLFLRARYITVADRLNPVAHRLSMILLWTVFFVLIYTNYQAIISLEPGAAVAGMLLFATAFAVGYVAGGPSRENRRALSIMTFARAGTVSIMIATQVFAHQPQVLVMVTIMTVASVVLGVLLVVFFRVMDTRTQGAIPPVADTDL
jgi:BASS family bile acid:Na+ symporter